MLLLNMHADKKLSRKVVQMKDDHTSTLKHNVECIGQHSKKNGFSSKVPQMKYNHASKHSIA